MNIIQNKYRLEMERDQVAIAALGTYSSKDGLCSPRAGRLKL